MIIREQNTPSVPWLQEHVSIASVDEPLWVLLQNKMWRLQLRDYIVEHKLTDDFRSVKMAAEGLGIVMGLIIAA